MKKKPRFYRIRDFISLGFGYLASTGIVAVTAYFSPVALGLVAGAAGIKTFFDIRRHNKFIKEELRDHRKTGRLAGRLELSVRDMCQRLKLDPDNFPVYDFHPKPSVFDSWEHDNWWQRFKSRRKEKNKNSIRNEFKLVAQTPQAAALALGKPLVMVSEPLLTALNTDEVEGVLAHEFAHIGAKHVMLSLPKVFALAVTNITNVGLAAVSAFAAGVMVPVTAALGALGAAAVYTLRAMRKDQEEAKHKKPEKSLLDKIKEAKKENIKIGALILAPIVGVMAYANPTFLVVASAAYGIAKVSTMVAANVSRSNEYQADRAAVTAMGANPLALMTGLRKLEQIQVNSFEMVLGEKLPEKGFLSKEWNNLHASHPTMERRVKRLAKLAKKQGYPEEAIERAKSGDLASPRIMLPPHITKAMLGF